MRAKNGLKVWHFCSYFSAYLSFKVCIRYLLLFFVAYNYLPEKICALTT